MAEEEAEQKPAKKSSLVKPILVGLALAVMLGGGGFYAMYSGLLDRQSNAVQAKNDVSSPVQDVAFVALDPLIISLGSNGANRHLRFAAQLEVLPENEAKVAKLNPRFLDVLNGYLRALDATDLENPSALIRLRAQMLRRVQVVAGHGNVRDLLITEFVLN
ncbi:flagellar basal body protein FliL [Actibacterium mucosum KCTC 23349]|uniref:Flagellar protein FliL n=1 Tax=Actibacterium mucosum KCTC 23349 TaxID=1454373 RepID=A0A037ZLL3_9RHOB|nr:flagellar basal body-associated FliL family protein [Actibacterium mucosum]KAJ57331.1 flagellar basal body protein FliL [Actibacterium mucosum KCTC 23349]